MISKLRPALQFHQYQLLEQIGVGGQGVVWSAEDHKRNEIVAIKFNEASDSDQQQTDDLMFERQLGKLVNVQHSNILPIYDYGLEDEVRYMVSPYIPGGSLFEKIRRGPLPLEDALRFSTEVASAIDYLHGQGIIHRDLKSSNILLNLRDHTYLADFGLARTISDTTKAMHTGRGTPPYAPPEQHKRLEITLKSDIYSFGILLFEIFAGQLPWGGETVLGLQQLYSNREIQDPCEFNNTLPPLMKDVLRRVTSADPARRPSSASEVMKMIYYIFDIGDFPPPDELTIDRAEARTHDAGELFNQNLARWATDDTQNELGLTKFAVIHQDHKIWGGNKIQGGVGQFMLFHSLLYAYKDEHWWSTVSNYRDRLSVSSRLLARQNEALTERILNHLVKDRDPSLISGNESTGLAVALLEMAVKSTNRRLSRKLLSGLRLLIPSSSTWGDSTMSPELNKLLGELAVEDSDVGDQAARLIGHLRSKPAVSFILDQADHDRLIPALLEIQRSAGQLPASVPRNIRLRVTLDWVIQRLTTQPAQLFAAYMLALAGATLGIGSQVYLRYRLPEFMDIERISSSLIQGLITGTFFSLGIMLVRVIVERFDGASRFLRVLLGTAAGTVGMSIAFFLFHVLFLKTPPSGFLIAMGCLLIAFAYALGGLFRSRWAAMALSISAIFLAITLTWGLHVTMAASITELTPLFPYEYKWPLSKILFTSMIAALSMGVFGNLIWLGSEKSQPIKI